MNSTNNFITAFELLSNNPNNFYCFRLKRISGSGATGSDA